MVTFVETDRRAQALIAENLAHCGVESGYAIIRAGVERAVDDLPAASLDIVFLDPPYDERVDAVIAAAAEVIAPGGVLVLEHARRQKAPELAGRLIRVRQVTSGSSMLSFYSCPH